MHVFPTLESPIMTIFTTGPNGSIFLRTNQSLSACITHVRVVVNTSARRHHYIKAKINNS